MYLDLMYLLFFQTSILLFACLGQVKEWDSELEQLDNCLKYFTTEHKQKILEQLRPNQSDMVVIYGRKLVIKDMLPFSHNL